VVEADGCAHYFEELPVDYVHDSEFATADCYFTITLEYGPDHDKVDPFDISVGRIVQDDPKHSQDARYLHPVVRLYRRNELVAEHHVAENLENDWTGPAHRNPLNGFFSLHIASAELATPSGSETRQ
jgi:hypothetical protein